jgi:hypothetical protein
MMMMVVILIAVGHECIWGLSRVDQWKKRGKLKGTDWRRGWNHGAYVHMTKHNDSTKHCLKEEEEEGGMEIQRKFA